MTKPGFMEPVQSASDAAGRVAMAVVAITALGAAWFSAQSTMSGPASAEWAGLWRAAGLMMFSALFAIVALRPRMSPGLWELALFHKAAVAAISPFSSDPEAFTGGMIDLALAVIIAAAYISTKGWKGWTMKQSVGRHSMA